MLLEIGERLGAVGKGRPIADRRAERGRLHLVGGNAEPLDRPRVDPLEQLRISEARMRLLDLMLDIAVSRRAVLVVETPARSPQRRSASTMPASQSISVP